MANETAVPERPAPDDVGLTTGQRVVADIVGTAFIGLAIYGYFAGLSDAIAVAFLVLGSVFLCFGAFNWVPESFGIEGVTWRKQERRQAAIKNAEDEPNAEATVAALNAVFTVDPAAINDRRAVTQAGHVFEQVILDELRSTVADQALVKDVPSDAPDALLRTSDGDQVAVEVKYLPSPIRTREAGALVRRLRRAGVKKALLITGRILDPGEVDALRKLSGPDLRLEVLPWVESPFDRQRLEHRLRQLGVPTKPDAIEPSQD